MVYPMTMSFNEESNRITTSFDDAILFVEVFHKSLLSDVLLDGILYSNNTTPIVSLLLHHFTLFNTKSQQTHHNYSIHSTNTL